jgi:hypothetical protein
MNDNYRTLYDVPLPEGAVLDFAKNKRGVVVGAWLTGVDGKRLYVHAPDPPFSVTPQVLSVLRSLARVKVQTNDIDNRLAKRRIETAWKNVFPEFPCPFDPCGTV